MEFVGKALPLTDQDISDTAAALGCEPAVIQAVSEIESSGSGFLPDKRPMILFEAHIFARYTKHKWDSSHPNISSPSWNRALYGKGGTHQYDRLLEAIALDRHAALLSASWGRFQIMGFNFNEVGYPDVESLVTAMCESDGKNLAAFAEFCRTNHLVQALIDHDWVKFARGYNGAGYAENQYDIKLAKAYEKHKKDRRLVSDVEVAEFKAAVMKVQSFLRDKGFYRGQIDSDFGPASRLALGLYLDGK